MNTELPADLVFHLPPKQFADDMAQGLIFYRRLREQWRAGGGRVRLVERVAGDMLETAQIVADGADFHLIDFGDITHERVLNTGPSYLHPFWNCDPIGVRSGSSTGRQAFRPSEVDARLARRFTRKLRKRLVEGKQTHYKQSPEADLELKDGSIAIFLQREAFRGVAETKYLSHQEMLDAVCGAETKRQIVVKQHPLDHTDETRAMLEGAAKHYPNLHVSNANIHDILARAAVCVTINSAVGLEGYLHNVPLILCGDADFRHRAVVVKSPDQMGAALDKSIGRDLPFDKYLYWFLGENCMDARADDLTDQVLGRIAQSGFPIARFGLD